MYVHCTAVGTKRDVIRDRNELSRYCTRPYRDASYRAKVESNLSTLITITFGSKISKVADPIFGHLRTHTSSTNNILPIRNGVRY